MSPFRLLLLLVSVISSLSFIISSGQLLRRPSRWSQSLSEEPPAAPITITAKARQHLRSLASSDQLYLRMGIKSGGCSGMSYSMEIVDKDAVQPDDLVQLCEDVSCVVDPKSLLYLFGLHLDYSDALIGGGFQFRNPNAETSWCVPCPHIPPSTVIPWLTVVTPP